MKNKSTVIDKEYVSNCCSAPMNQDFSICPRCKEGCAVVELEDEPSEKIGRSKNYFNMKKKEEIKIIEKALKLANKEIKEWQKFKALGIKKLNVLNNTKYD